MLIILASLPLILFFGLILIGRKTVLFSALFSIISIVIIGIAIWQIEILRIVSASLKGTFIAFEIILIIFGALLILEILKKKDLFLFLKNIFEVISKDERVHVILLGWSLIYFLEGIAGFGTPAMIVIPIFIALGFSPISAVILSLVGNSVPVIFGAVGLPVIYGIGSIISGLNTDPFIIEHLSLLISGLNIIGSTIVPVILIYLFSKIEKKPRSHFIEFIPFALMAGLITSVSAFATNYLIGPELPSVVGGAISILLVSILAKNKILIPKTEEEEKLAPVTLPIHKIKNTLKALTPYFLVFSLLILSRLPFLPIKDFLLNLYPLNISALFGFQINYSFFPFYSVGVIMIFSALISFLLIGISKKVAKESLTEALNKVQKPFLSLVAILIFVQIYAYSGDNLSGLKSMLVILAEGASSVFGLMWPIVAPFIGALGSFTSGSATVSNLIFSGFQYQTAMTLAFDPILILALQGIGAAAGNMISLHNVIAALVVANLVGKEGEIIKKILPSLLLYLFLMGIIGFILSLI